MKMFRVVVNGSEYKVGIEELPDQNPQHPPQASPVSSGGSTLQPAQQKTSHQTPQKPAPPGGNTNTQGRNVTAPIPGTILTVMVTAGAVVSKGQTLLILEAMKMENEIKAPWDGTIKEITVSPGASVNAGDILIVLAP